MYTYKNLSSTTVVVRGVRLGVGQVAKFSGPVSNPHLVRVPDAEITPKGPVKKSKQVAKATPKATDSTDAE